jgi:hypothetical protein
MTEEINKQKLRDANFCIGSGVGIGALGAAGSVILGATCPFCFIGAPLLIGVGLYQRAKAKREGEPGPKTASQEGQNN